MLKSSANVRKSLRKAQGRYLQLHGSLVSQQGSDIRFQRGLTLQIHIHTGTLNAEHTTLDPLGPDI